MELVGGTPLYRLKKETGGAEVWVKLEGSNPGGSIKDRAAWGMLKDAQERGLLSDSSVIVEPTSGNTGIGLAMLGRALGLSVILTMPESMSAERRAVLSAFGAELILTPASEGMAGSVAAAEKILKENPKAVMLDQFSNPGNPKAHEETTGPETGAAAGRQKARSLRRLLRHRRHADRGGARAQKRAPGRQSRGGRAGFQPSHD